MSAYFLLVEEDGPRNQREHSLRKRQQQRAEAGIFTGGGEREGGLAQSPKDHPSQVKRHLPPERLHTTPCR